MTPASLLGPRPDSGSVAAESRDPESFCDLHLSLVVDRLLADRRRYDLRGLYQQLPADRETVIHRRDVVADLLRPEVRVAVSTFARGMSEARQATEASRASRDPRQGQRWQLDAVGRYCRAVSGLAEGLSTVDLQTAPWRDVRSALVEYTQGEAFSAMQAEVECLEAALADISYSLNIQANRVHVTRTPSPNGTGRLAEETAALFESFRASGDSRRSEATVRVGGDLDHIQARILEAVGHLFAEVFDRVGRFVAGHTGFVEEWVGRLERECQFYLSYLDGIEPLVDRGLSFSQATISDSDEVAVTGGFDLALALGGSDVVLNDFSLRGTERILVVTGPNQGGKTTFARMVGQVYHLAALGLPVPAAAAVLAPADRVFTHFGREEQMADLRGALKDDLLRAASIFRQASSRSVVIFNELFTSTTVDDARLLGERILRGLGTLGSVGVYVTFVEELAELDERTVSMVGGVDPVDPTRRTFRVERRAPEGRAHATALAQRFGLGYEVLSRRLAR